MIVEPGPVFSSSDSENAILSQTDLLVTDASVDGEVVKIDASAEASPGLHHGESVTDAWSAMLVNENRTLHSRLIDLESRVHDQASEIGCLKSTLADTLHRLQSLECDRNQGRLSADQRASRQRSCRLEVGGCDEVTDSVDGVSQDSGIGRCPTIRHSVSNGSIPSLADCQPDSDGLAINNSRSTPISAHQSRRCVQSPVTQRRRPSDSSRQQQQGQHSHLPVIRVAADKRFSIQQQWNGGWPNMCESQRLHSQQQLLSQTSKRKWNSTSDFGSSVTSNQRRLDRLSQSAQKPARNYGLTPRKIQPGSSMLSLRSPLGSGQLGSLCGPTSGIRHGLKDATYDDRTGCLTIHVRGKPIRLHLPSAVSPTFSLTSATPGKHGAISPATLSVNGAPAQAGHGKLPRLQVDWVYGYRGKDARNNLFMLPTGEMIYFKAAVVILYNAEEHCQRHYLGHTTDVKCIDVHPNRTTIATGQCRLDDVKEYPAQVHVWNSISLQTLHIIGRPGEFDRAVIAVSFSKSDGGHLLALISEDSTEHIISIWDWNAGPSSRQSPAVYLDNDVCSTSNSSTNDSSVDSHKLVLNTSTSVKLNEVRIGLVSDTAVVGIEFHPLTTSSIVTFGRSHVHFWTLDSVTFKLSRRTGLFPSPSPNSDKCDLRSAVRPRYVTALAFSCSGDILTGDSNGQLIVWSNGGRPTSDWRATNSCVSAEGSMSAAKVVSAAHAGPVFAICVLRDGSIVSGGGKDGRLVLYDTSLRRRGSEAQLPAHLGCIRSIAQSLTSSSSSSGLVSDSVQLIVGTTHNCILRGSFKFGFAEIVTGHSEPILALACHPETANFVSAGIDSRLRMWDGLTKRTVWTTSVGEDVQCAAFGGPNGDLLIVGLTSGSWMALDSSTRQVYHVGRDTSVAVNEVEQATISPSIQAAAFSPDSQYVALASMDHVIYVYQIVKNEQQLYTFSRMGRCSGHTAGIINLDWSSDSVYIRSNSVDNELLFWNAAVCRPVQDGGFQLRDIPWATQTCIISAETIGIWPSSLSSDNSTAVAHDITACCSSGQSSGCDDGQIHLASGDDTGKIRLYAYPAYHPKTTHSVSVGPPSHTAAVSRLTFLSGDKSRLVSAGGRDSTLIQWRLVSLP